MKKILGFFALVTMVLAMNSYATAGSSCGSGGGAGTKEDEATTDQTASVPASGTDVTSDEVKPETKKASTSGN